MSVESADVACLIHEFGNLCFFFFSFLFLLWSPSMAPHSILLPGESRGWRSLEGCSPWGRWGSDRTERLHFHFSLSCIGEGNGNPLQCSCLENPRDGRAWWAAVYGVSQSRTRLKRLSSSSSRGVSTVLISLWQGTIFNKWSESHSVVSDCLPPHGLTVHGILQNRTLEWVAYPFSSRSSWPRNLTGVSCIAGGLFTSRATREALYSVINYNRKEC